MTFLIRAFIPQSPALSVRAECSLTFCEEMIDRNPVLHSITATLLLAASWALVGCDSEAMKDSLHIKRAFVADDWPDGDHSNKDRWRGGIFYGLKADKIRRVARPKHSGVDAKSIEFFARIPMNLGDFEAFMTRLESTENYEYQPAGSYIPTSLTMRPGWFPYPTETNFIGTAKDDSSWRVKVFWNDTDSLYLHLH